MLPSLRPLALSTPLLVALALGCGDDERNEPGGSSGAAGASDAGGESAAEAGAATLSGAGPSSAGGADASGDPQGGSGGSNASVGGEAALGGAGSPSEPGAGGVPGGPVPACQSQPCNVNTSGSCCVGASCVRAEGDGSRCREDCQVDGDCATGCCAQLAGAGPKVCLAAEYCSDGSCSPAETSCENSECCPGTTCTDYGGLRCRKLCENYMACQSGCCYMLDPQEANACFPLSVCL